MNQKKKRIKKIPPMSVINPRVKSSGFSVTVDAIVSSAIFMTEYTSVSGFVKWKSGFLVPMLYEQHF